MREGQHGPSRHQHERAVAVGVYNNATVPRASGVRRHELFEEGFRECVIDGLSRRRIVEVENDALTARERLADYVLGGTDGTG